MSSIHETAEKLHALGHEVAAAAVRRSAHPDWDVDEDSFRGLRTPRRPLGTAIGRHIPDAFQPGFANVFDERGRSLGRVHPALRVGKRIGPVSPDELRDMGFQGTIFGDTHPLVTAGHGLHPVHDPSPESFDFLKQHINNPSMWPIVADHFEDGGTTRGNAMARLLRHPVSTHKVGNWLGNFGNASPVTWPIQVRYDSYVNGPIIDRFTIGKHSIDVPVHGNLTLPDDLKAR